MVNTQLLDDKISRSGLKTGFICEKIGISRQAFYKKKNNINCFREAERFVIKTILNLSDEEVSEIFFAEKS